MISAQYSIAAPTGFQIYDSKSVCYIKIICVNSSHYRMIGEDRGFRPASNQESAQLPCKCGASITESESDKLGTGIFFTGFHMLLANVFFF